MDFKLFYFDVAILPALSTDYSPLLISFLNGTSDKNGKGSWKFNNSLVYDAVYVEKMKKFITKINNSNEFIENSQTKWVFLKYEISILITQNHY